MSIVYKFVLISLLMPLYYMYSLYRGHRFSLPSVAWRADTMAVIRPAEQAWLAKVVTKTMASVRWSFQGGYMNRSRRRDGGMGIRTTQRLLFPRHRVFKCSKCRARICKRLWSPGIDKEETIPPAYEAWHPGTTNRVVVPARQAGNRFLGSLKRLTDTGSGCRVPEGSWLA